MKTNRRMNIKKRLYTKQKGICYLCHQLMTPTESTLEHIIPKSLGGRDSIKNFAVSHSTCNGVRGSEDIKPPQHYIEMRSKIKRNEFALPTTY